MSAVLSAVPSTDNRTTKTNKLPTVFITHCDNMRADLKKFWGIISGKQTTEKPQPKPRLRSTSLPRITSYGLIGFGTYEAVQPKEDKCTPMWYEYDLGKKCNTFPRRSMKQKRRPKIAGRDRSASVSVEVNPEDSESPQYQRRGSATRNLKVDIDATIKEEETLDVSKLKRKGFEDVKKKKDKNGRSTQTTVLCSTEL